MFVCGRVSVCVITRLQYIAYPGDNIITKINFLKKFYGICTMIVDLQKFSMRDNSKLLS